MKKMQKTLAIFMALMLLCTMVAGLEAHASRGYNFVDISSSDGMIYPDIEKHRKE